ncbi:SEC-C motif family protein [Geobacillus kaustophilus]|uniref:SEC-C motif family protein n=1 Tax=Geobacillus kaustophilus TaxID=1462 RepID=A0A0D8BRD4_GEOKU|nr:SEC-C metal-binding domain-containing protein [Geobacillus kaustophilus]KJE26753.1 SEC-C motif family protein [Geobacillus kaustophilus]
MSIGRNDPCPCGSGKKYKKCCMNKQQQHEIKRMRQRRFFDQKYELSQMVQRFLDESLSYDEREAVTRMFRQMIEQKDHREELKVFETLWRFFLHRYPNGLRGIEWFQEEKGRRLSPELKEMLDRWVRLVPRLVQFVDLHDEGGVAIDRLTGERLLMPYCETLEIVRPWGGMFAFLEPFDGGYYVCGVSSIVDPKGVERAEENIRSLLTQTGWPYDKVAVEHFLDIVDVAYPPMPDDVQEERTRWTYEYECKEAAEAVRKLASIGRAQIDNDDGEKVEGSWCTNVYHYIGLFSPEPIRVFELGGSLSAHRSRLVLSTEKEQTAEQLVSLLRAFGYSLKERKRQTEGILRRKGVENVSFHIDPEPGSPPWAGTLAGLAVQLEKALHVPHEQWNGKTPHEMAREGHVQEVDEWLKVYEFNLFNMQERANLPVSIGVNHIRSRYGLPLSPFDTSHRSSDLWKMKWLGPEETDTLWIRTEWEGMFFTDDLLTFYNEIAMNEKAEEIKETCLLVVLLLCEYMEGRSFSSWGDVGEEDWKQCIVEQIPTRWNSLPWEAVSQALDMLPELAGWLDRRYGTKHRKAVCAVLEDVRSELEHCFALLDEWGTERGEANEKLAVWQFAHSFGLPVPLSVDFSFFRVKYVERGKAVLDWLVHNRTVTWDVPERAEPHLLPGMYIIAVVDRNGKVSDLARAYPPAFSPYLEPWLQALKERPDKVEKELSALQERVRASAARLIRRP